MLTAGVPETSHVPPGRVAALARFATVAKAQAVARMPEERRMATLLAFVRILEATAQDDVLDLLVIVVTKLFSDVAAVGKKTRLRTIRDLDAAALKLRHAGAVLMDDTVDDAAMRAAAFAKVTRADLAHTLEQIDLLIRPPGDLYFAELRAQNSKLRFMPALLRAIAFGAAPAGQPVLDAVHHLRANEKRGPSGAAPLAFVPSGWKRRCARPTARSTRLPTGFACWRACGPPSGVGTAGVGRGRKCPVASAARARADRTDLVHTAMAVRSGAPSAQPRRAQQG